MRLFLPAFWINVSISSLERDGIIKPRHSSTLFKRKLVLFIPFVYFWSTQHIGKACVHPCSNLFSDSESPLEMSYGGNFQFNSGFITGIGDWKGNLLTSICRQMYSSIYLIGKHMLCHDVEILELTDCMLKLSLANPSLLGLRPHTYSSFQHHCSPQPSLHHHPGST